MCRLENENSIGVIPASLLFLTLFGLIFGVGAGGSAALAAEVLDCGSLVQWWTVISALISTTLAVSYWCIARYGLRFHELDPHVDPLWCHAAVGNISWRSLPRTYRDAQRPRLRALNSGLRVILATPEDEDTRRTVATLTEYLKNLSITVLPDAEQDDLPPR